MKRYAPWMILAAGAAFLVYRTLTCPIYFEKHQESQLFEEGALIFFAGGAALSFLITRLERLDRVERLRWRYMSGVFFLFLMEETNWGMNYVYGTVFNFNIHAGLWHIMQKLPPVPLWFVLFVLLEVSWFVAHVFFMSANRVLPESLRRQAAPAGRPERLQAWMLALLVIYIAFDSFILGDTDYGQDIAQFLAALTGFGGAWWKLDIVLARERQATDPAAGR